jgi:tetratricopeptide (TPR) repeat protein/predicted Ser/Thr protein kinase
MIAVADGFERGAAIGHFLVLDRIGAGGMGVVFRAYDPELDRKVAIKLLRAPDELADVEEARARMLREAQALARVTHPNVVAVHEVGVHDGRVFLVMEFVDGETLATWQAAPDRAVDALIEAYVDAARGLAAAHRAGLVHRDFKPENVLVGRDGRVRVVDFGLVGLVAPSGEVADEVDGPVDLTRTGMMLGTPRYMAPEQHRRDPLTARTDQFGFSIALWTALAGAPPFEGATYRALVRNVLAGTRTEPPRDSRMAPHVRRALERGLAVEPEARWPDMDALIAALAPPRQRSRAGLLAVGGAVAIAATAATAALVLTRSDEPAAPVPCAGMAALLAPIWSPARGAELTRALHATGATRADAAAATITGRLDAFGAAWIDARQATCAATRVRGDQSEAVMDLRMRCLDQRARELDALAATLASTTARQIDQAVAATYKLTPIDACADVVALSAPIPPPTAAALRVLVDQLGAAEARVKARADAGRYQEAVALGLPLVIAANATGYRPLAAELTQLLGDAEAQAGDAATARTSLDQAAWLAEASHHDALAARAWTSLAFVAGYLGGDAPAGDRAARQADAAVLRIGDPPEARGRLELNLGAIAYGRGDAPGAIAHWELARALWTRALGDDHPDVARVLNNLGAVYGDVGRDEDATVALRRAITIWARAFGERHPLTARARHNLGAQLRQLGALDDARAELEASAAALAEILGDTHAEVDMALADLANVYLDLGRLDDAARTIGRCEEIERHGTPRPMTYVNMAAIQRAQGHTADARAALARGLALLAGPVAGQDHTDRGFLRATAADLELDDHRWPTAEAAATEALADLERAGGPRSPALLDPLLVQARARLERGDLVGADAALVRALDLAIRQPLMQVRARLVLADLRVRQGRGADGRAAAQAARASLTALHLDAVPEAAALDAWLVAHT